MLHKTKTRQNKELKYRQKKYSLIKTAKRSKFLDFSRLTINAFQKKSKFPRTSSFLAKSKSNVEFQSLKLQQPIFPNNICIAVLSMVYFCSSEFS